MSAAAGAGDAQYRKMTQTPIPRLVATLAVPTIISMLVTAVYNMADTFFVAQLGTSAAGAVGIRVFADGRHPGHRLHAGYGRGQSCFPLSGCERAAAGGLVRRPPHFLRRGLRPWHRRCWARCFWTRSCVCWVATPTILPYARDYARYILFGAPVMCASFVLNNSPAGRGQGHAGHGGHRPGRRAEHRLDRCSSIRSGLASRARPLPRCSASASASPFF